MWVKGRKKKPIKKRYPCAKTLFFVSATAAQDVICSCAFYERRSKIASIKLNLAVGEIKIKLNLEGEGGSFFASTHTHTATMQVIFFRG